MEFRMTEEEKIRLLTNQQYEITSRWYDYGGEARQIVLFGKAIRIPFARKRSVWIEFITESGSFRRVRMERVLLPKGASLFSATKVSFPEANVTLSLDVTFGKVASLHCH